MSLLFIDGFDHYDPQALDGLGNPHLARGKASYLSPGATRINGRRPASKAMRLPSGAGGGYAVALGATKTSLILGAALRLHPWANTGNLPVLMGVSDVSGSCSHYVRLTSDGRLRLVRRVNGWDSDISGGVGALHPGGWHYVEFLITQHASAGTLTVRINGVTALTLAGQNTIQGYGQLASAFIGALPGHNAFTTCDLDDLYLADTSGSLNNTFLGDCRVDTLAPNGAGTHNQFALTGAASAWEAWSDGNEASYAQASALGQRTTVQVQNLPAMTTPAVHGVQVTALARKTDAGNSLFRALALSSGNLASKDGAPLLEDVAVYRSALFETNPNGGAAWTQAAVDAAEFGVESA